MEDGNYDNKQQRSARNKYETTKQTRDAVKQS